MREIPSSAAAPRWAPRERAFGNHERAVAKQQPKHARIRFTNGTLFKDSEQLHRTVFIVVDIKLNTCTITSKIQLFKVPSMMLQNKNAVRALSESAIAFSRPITSGSKSAAPLLHEKERSPAPPPSSTKSKLQIRLITPK